MKKILLLVFMLSFLSGYSQVSIPIDFESSITTGDFTDFDGGVATVITNPQSGGINTSANVGQIVRNGGQQWAGSKVTLASNFDPTTLGTISMKVFTEAPVGTVIKLKLEGGTGTYEVDAVTKSSGIWETLTWNFSAAPNNHTTLAFMFDFGNVGDGTATSTFLFDDLIQIVTPPASPLFIDFENSYVTSDFIDFDGGTATVLSNPQSGGINTSATVGQIIRNGGQLWAGSKLILSDNLNFTSNGYIIMKVYTTAPIGTMVKFKLEGNGSTEVDVLTTVTGAWETLAFNFTGQPANFNTLALMFDFGNVGNGTATSTFLFDDIAQSADGINPVTTGIIDNKPVNVELFPNPTKDVWSLSTIGSINLVSVFDAMGNNVLETNPNTNAVILDGSNLSAGVYFAKVSTTNSTNVVRLVKE